MRGIVLRAFVASGLLMATLGHVSAQQDGAPSRATKPAVVVNLNAASADQLASLPGIGERTAQLIVEYRQKNGPFKKSEDLMNVKGIGEKSFLKLRSLVTTEPAKPERTVPPTH